MPYARPYVDVADARYMKVIAHHISVDCAENITTAPDGNWHCLFYDTRYLDGQPVRIAWSCQEMDFVPMPLPPEAYGNV